MGFYIIMSYLIFALMIFAPIGILLFILANKKLGKPSDRLFYLAFWLFFWFVLSFPNYYLSFLIVGDNCTYTVEGEKHCSMVIAQLMCGISLAMIESGILLIFYRKMPENTAKNWIKKAVFMGFCLVVLFIITLRILKILGI